MAEERFGLGKPSGGGMALSVAVQLRQLKPNHVTPSRALSEPEELSLPGKLA